MRGLIVVDDHKAMEAAAHTDYCVGKVRDACAKAGVAPSTTSTRHRSAAPSSGKTRASTAAAPGRAKARSTASTPDGAPARPRAAASARHFAE